MFRVVGPIFQMQICFFFRLPFYQYEHIVIEAGRFRNFLSLFLFNFKIQLALLRASDFWTGNLVVCVCMYLLSSWLISDIETCGKHIYHKKFIAHRNTIMKYTKLPWIVLLRSYHFNVERRASMNHNIAVLLLSWHISTTRREMFTKRKAFLNDVK